MESPPSPSYAGHNFSRIAVFAEGSGSEERPPFVQRMPAAPHAAPEAAAGGLIVEDESPHAGHGRVGKAEFLAALREALSKIAEAEAGFVCPGIDQLFATYGPRPAAKVEAVIRRYLSGAAGVTDAMEYIPLIGERARGAIRRWKRTGEVTGIPAEVQDTLPVPLPGPAIARKGRDGSPPSGNDPPVAIQGQLGSGRPVDGSIQARFGPAMGLDFSRVRVHDDAAAARLCSRLDARAFTVGPDVAFAPGEFQPGTPVGDALLAHELAHVAQQKTDGGQSGNNPAAYDALEEDADRSAIGTVLSLWGHAKAHLKTMGSTVLPALRSGLRLQRCSNSKSSGAIGPVRQAEAMANFRKKNDDEFSPAEFDKIDSALRKTSGDNPDLIISFYDYFSNHTAKKDPALEAKHWDAKLDPGGLVGSPEMGINPKALDPAWSDTRLGASLIHEFSHTRHEKGMGVGDSQEGDAYGIEYFFAGRNNEKERMDIIVGLISDPRKLWLDDTEYRGGVLRFQKSYATLVALYEVIDGKPPRGGVDGPFAKLSAEEARRLVARLIDAGSGNVEVASSTSWVEQHLSDFKLPVSAPGKY